MNQGHRRVPLRTTTVGTLWCRLELARPLQLAQAGCSPHGDHRTQHCSGWPVVLHRQRGWAPGLARELERLRTFSTFLQLRQQRQLLEVGAV
jgi:hypothetical protein